MPSSRLLVYIITLAVTSFAETGCATTGITNDTMATSQTTLGQRLLDKYLSPGFTGDLDIRETIPLYLSVTLQGANLRREDDGWKYDWIEYNRNGPFGTSARIVLGKRP
jgi:hypothetical protein